MIADRGDRLFGVHVDPAQPLDRDLPEGVQDRLAELAKRGDQPRPLLLGADAGGVDGQQRLVANRLRYVGERRGAQEADDRGDLVGNRSSPVTVGTNSVGAELGCEDQRPGVDVRDRRQLELERGDDRIAAPAPPQRPEQIGVGVGIDPASFARRGHQLDRVDPVTGEPVAATEPAQPATQRVADDADVGGRARHRAEPVGLRRGADLERQHPGLDPCPPIRGADLDPAHPLCLDHDRVVERTHRRRAVPGRLAEDLELVVGREPDRRGDVLGALDEGDRARVRVGGAGSTPGAPRPSRGPRASRPARDR